MNTTQPILYFFPLDNLLEDVIEKKIVNIEASDLNGAIINFDQSIGSYLKFTNNNFIQKTINAPLSDKNYTINFFVKFDKNPAHTNFFSLDEILKISTDNNKNILVNTTRTNQKIEIDNWYNFTIEIKGKDIRVLLFKDEIISFAIKNTTSMINTVKLAGTHISFSRWSIQDNFYTEEIRKIDELQVNSSELEYTDIRFSLYNENTTNKNHLIIEDTEGKPQSLILEIDFGKHTPQLNDKLPVGIIKAKKGFFRTNTSLEENKSDWFIKIDKAVSINSGNIQTYILENVEIINLADQDQVLLHLELFNITVDGIDITEENSIKADKTVLIQDNRGINICPFDCYIINGDTFTYGKDYDSFKGQNLTISLENITDEIVVFSKNKAVFSIDLTRFNLFKFDKLQDKNITIKNSNGKTIINKNISQNNTKLEVCITEEVKLVPGDYLQFTISGLKVFPTANSVGKFPFYINYRNIDNYRSGKCKFIIESTIIDKDNYIGNWLDGKSHGYGVYTWENGDRYEGNWLDGKRHGYGVYTWKNGDLYKGNWLDGKYHGHGVYNTKSKDDEYTGYYLNGKRNGYGVKKDANGDRYEGNWLDHKKHGYGVNTNANGNYYEGNWEENKKHGHGVSIASNNIIAIGKFKNNSGDGHLVMIWPDGAIYVGEYSNSSYNGKGVLLWPGGKFDKGTFKNGALVSSNY